MLKIAQSQSYQGDHWWEWSVWLAGAPDELDTVDEVVWLLHPTFKPSKISCKVRSNGFKLSTSGWGVFTIKADVRLQDGGIKRLTHELELLYPDGTATSA